MKSSPRIYLDYASATPIDPVVRSTITPFLDEYFHNPSALYHEGVRVRADIEEARKKVADILKVSEKTIYFVDGATEANNLAMRGVVAAWKKNHPNQTPHIICSEIEHPSVIEVFKRLEEEGAEVSYLSVDDKGKINIHELKKILKKPSVLISIGYANGEIGSVQDLRSIMKVVRHSRKSFESDYPLFHTDAVQAMNYCEEVGIPRLGVDMLVLNAGKIYGPKKIAVLYKREGVECEPMVVGGNQEHGMRAGTEDAFGIVGLATALDLARETQEEETARLRLLQRYFQEKLLENFPEIILNSGSDQNFLPNIVNISFPVLSHEEIMIRLDAKGIMCSVKSACKAEEEGDSHVIIALRKENGLPAGSLRFSMGRFTQKKDVDDTLLSMAEILPAMLENHHRYYA